VKAVLEPPCSNGWIVIEALPVESLTGALIARHGGSVGHVTVKIRPLDVCRREGDECVWGAKLLDH